MKRVCHLVAAVILVLVVLSVAGRIYDMIDLRGTVYTVQQVDLGLQGNPGAWAGHSILVQGLVQIQGLARDCPASGCRSTLLYETLTAPDGNDALVVEVPWYHYPGALRVLALENRQTIQSLPSPLRDLAYRILDPMPPRGPVVQRISILPPGHCPTFTSICPVAVLEH